MIHSCAIPAASPKTWRARSSRRGCARLVRRRDRRRRPARYGGHRRAAILLSAARLRLRVVADDGHDPYTGLKGRHRTLELTPADADRLGVAEDALVEMFGSHPAPLRAWVRIGGTAGGAVRMDAFGRKVLGAGNDELIYIRRVETPTVPKGLARSTR